ncbi:divalent-cation tolerance protein CutA [Aliifodinibius sp. S!AR15-10]|uniref:divalent-cation tolerance protein CutA n=1 Tax=Aliifodinibius sp. S!AR15-10 TaxID=2950437 RepID=UPI00286627E0|nr:divalent-cation tolerance protein CutA [Aliifodinibius sp. S!AR15-10]MDR8394166.1 divalent-cation tolerance protein CutA [Aliifodinibius sp. S!AR15-10]
MFYNLRLVYITTKDKDEARKIGRSLVEEKLAACVNIIDGMESIYRWKGKVEEAKEAILIAKTPYHNVKPLTQRVKDLHSYNCPCVISLTLTEQEGNEDYLRWLIKETKKQEINYEIEGEDIEGSNL